MFHNVLRVFHNVLRVFHDVLLCLTMFSESRNDQHHPISNSASANGLRDHDNSVGMGNNSAEIGDDATGIVDIAAKVIPC